MAATVLITCIVCWKCWIAWIQAVQFCNRTTPYFSYFQASRLRRILDGVVAPSSPCRRRFRRSANRGHGEGGEKSRPSKDLRRNSIRTGRVKKTTECHSHICRTPSSENWTRGSWKALSTHSARLGKIICSDPTPESWFVLSHVTLPQSYGDQFAGYCRNPYSQ